MPMTQEQRDNWFTYHPPTPETAPKYAAIREAESVLWCNIAQAHIEAGADIKQVYEEINRSTRRFAEIIDANAPDSADKTAALRCVRLGRNLFNEHATQVALPPHKRAWKDPEDLLLAANLEIAKARMQANSAIACGGK